MNLTFLGLTVVVGMWGGTLLMLDIGRRLGRRKFLTDPDGAKASYGAIDGSIFGLLGLLIAFTFSGAASRFDARREMIIQEANAIGTAWLRLDLLPAAAQPGLRELFRQYLDARLAAFRKIPDLAAARVELDRANRLQQEIWTRSLTAARDASPQPATMLLTPALNDMFDSATERTAKAQMHPPMVIYVMLGLLLLAGSMLAGYGMGIEKVRDWFHALAFVIVMTLAVYVIIDFEFPRMGIIRIQGFDQVLMVVRESMN